MYHIVKPITEWHHYDCRPKNSARPVNRDQRGEPIFDYHDMRATSMRGDRFLNECHEEARRGEGRAVYREDPIRYDYENYETMNRHQVPRKHKMATKHMNEVQGLAVALLDNFTTIKCDNPHSSNDLTFKKPLNMELEKGDKTICSFNDGSIQIMEVTEVHGEIVNPDDIKLCWVVQKIDTVQYEHLLELDQKAVDKIKQMQQNKARRELLAEFDQDELKLLSSDLELKDD